MAGPRLINSGKPAVEAVATVLKTARPTTVTGPMGPVDLKPGTIWSGDKMLVDPSASVVLLHNRRSPLRVRHWRLHQGRVAQRHGQGGQVGRSLG